MTDPDRERLLVIDNTCLSAFATANLMGVLKDLTVGAFRDGKVVERRAADVLDALRASGSRYPCDGASLLAWARQHNLLD